MRFRACQYLITQKPFDRYCGAPAEEVNNVPGYLYLCRKHHTLLDGRSKQMSEFSKGREKEKLKRICPTCKKELRLQQYRKRSLRNFCDHKCRGKFYGVKNGGKKKK